MSETLDNDEWTEEEFSLDDNERLRLHEIITFVVATLNVLSCVKLWMPHSQKLQAVIISLPVRVAAVSKSNRKGSHSITDTGRKMDIGHLFG